MKLLKFRLYGLAVLIAITVAGLFLSCEPASYDYEFAKKKLDSMVKGIKYTENYTTRSSQINMNSRPTLADNLPDISNYEFSVEPGRVTSNDVVVEIFASTEKSSLKDPDNWLVEVAEDFNSQNIKLSDGKIAKLKIRKIASGDGFQYIASKKYIPDAYTPSNDLWVKMVEASGTSTTLISEKMVGNIAGIVMKNKVYADLQKSFGKVEVRTVIEAVIKGVNDPDFDFSMGYTDPFASSTGLNFLITILSTYAQNDMNQLLSEGVISAFEAFQQGVPFVALTTLQMRSSAENNGSLDAFVMEYQSFYKSDVLRTNYKFIPFGFRHDNPLYALGSLSEEKLEVLKKLASFCQSSSIKSMADRYGFNAFPEYKSSYDLPPGNLLISAQQLWKEKKDAGRPIVAVFLSDVSGSMTQLGSSNKTALKQLQDALIEGSNFIAQDNYIGLVEFNNQVNVRLPIKKFNVSHQSKFNAAVEDMVAEGKTAMYDGILVALNLLTQALNEVPNGKPMLFALTDGATNMGKTFGEVKKTIEGLGIPIYTIGYNVDLSDLQEVSNLTEAAVINADDEQIKFKIGALLNAEM